MQRALKARYSKFKPIFLAIFCAVALRFSQAAQAAPNCAAIFRVNQDLIWSRYSYFFPGGIEKSELEAEFAAVLEISKDSRVFRPMSGVEVFVEGKQPASSAANPKERKVNLGITGDKLVVRSVFRHELAHILFDDAFVVRHPEFVRQIDGNSEKAVDAKRMGKKGLYWRLAEAFCERAEEHIDGNGATTFNYVSEQYPENFGGIPPSVAAGLRRFDQKESLSRLLKKWQDGSNPQSTSLHSTFVPAGVYLFRIFHQEIDSSHPDLKKVKLFYETLFEAMDMTYAQMVSAPGFTDLLSTDEAWPFDLNRPGALTPAKANLMLMKKFRALWKQRSESFGRNES